MASLNKVMLIGNLGQKPELHYGNSMAVTQLSVATSYGTGDQQVTEWHKVKIFDKLAESCARYLDKGSSVYVEGRLKRETWKDRQSGADRSDWVVIASTVTFLDRPARRGEAPSGSSRPAPSSGYGAGSSVADDDDVPF